MPFTVSEAAYRISAGPLLSDVRAQLLKQLDTRSMGAFMTDANWYEALGEKEIEPAARSAIEHAADQPFGNWPPLDDWKALADRARALKAGNPHATLLSNLWFGSKRLSSGAVGIEQAQYSALKQDVSLFGVSLFQTPGFAPECVITSPQSGLRLLSADGGERMPAAFEHRTVRRNQGPGYCDVVDPLGSDNAWRPCVVYSPGAGTYGLFHPEQNEVTGLPLSGDCTLFAVSSNGRFVVGAPQSTGSLFVHDRWNPNRELPPIELPVKPDGTAINPLQLSVDSDGNLFVASADEGVQLDPWGAVRQRTTLDCVRGNFRLDPSERYLLTNDETGTNLRLEHRHGGGSKILRHPAATKGTALPLRIRSMAMSPVDTWIATVSEDTSATLSIYCLVGIEHDAILDPVVQMPLLNDRPVLDMGIAIPWFEPDGSALNLFLGTQWSRGVQRVRLPLV